MTSKDGRFCDRCGKPLTRKNNICGYEICDSCNEIVEKQVKAEKVSDFKPYLDDLRKTLNRSERTPENDRDKVFHVHGSVWHRVIARDQNDAEIKFLEKLKKDSVDDLHMQVCFVRYDDSQFVKRASASIGESCMIDQGITQGIV